MSGHTPGPWFFEPKPFDEDTVEITAASREGYIPVATVASAGEEEDPEYPMLAEQRANARLIAAAPDLLSALEEIADYRGGATNALEDEYVMERVRDAIAKALGDVS